MMKLQLIIISILIFVNEINAMDLLDKNKLENFKNKWEFVSDQVMGGLSTGKLDLIKDENEKFLRLSGDVSTKNNGGFIQFRSNIQSDNQEYEGIRIKVKGHPSDYFIHVRTNFLFLPWQYYSGRFSVTDEWKEIKVFFKDFEKSNFYQPSTFNSSEIKSIGFVAFGKDFSAQLDLIEAKLF